MKILVSADYHIGLNDNHDDDILRACDEIAKVIERQEIAIHIIAGDVFNMSRPTPKMYKFFGNCVSSFLAVDNFIIVGNHDVHTNYNTLDTYNSVLKRERLNFINQFGVYKPEQLTTFFFAPFQISDDLGEDIVHEIDRSVLLKDQTILLKNQTNILFTHINIPGAKFGIEREIQLGNVGSLCPIKKDKVDLIISGHIHKHQIGTYGSIPYVYPGSLACTSFGEEKESKGFVVIDTASLEIQFIKRKTTRKWITVDVDWKGKLPIIQKKGDVLRVNIQALSKQRGAIDRNKIESELLKRYAQVKLNINYTSTKIKKTKHTIQTQSFVDFENQWIEQHCFKYKKEVTQKIRQILNLLQGSKIVNKEYKGLYLKELCIQNYQNICNFKHIFKTLQSVGILGEINGKLSQSNGGGKSSIVEAIRWLLYGTTRFARNVDAIQDNCDMMQGSLILENQQGQQFKIVRQLDNKKKSKNQIIKLSSKKSEKDIVLVQGSMVTQWVYANFGLDLKSFDALIYLGKDRHRVIGVRATERLKAFQEPLPLEVYTKNALNEIKQERKSIKNEVTQTYGVIEEYECRLMNDSELQEYENEKKNLQKNLELRQSEQQKIYTELQKLRKQEKVLQEFSELQTSLKTLKLDIGTLQKELATLEIEDIKQKTQEYTLSCQRVDLSQTYVNDLGNQKQQLQIQIAELKKKITSLDSVQDSSCPFCLGELPTTIKIKRLDELKKQVVIKAAKLTKVLQEENKKKTELKKILLKKEQMMQVLAQIKSNLQRAQQIDKLLKKNEERIIQVETKLKSVKYKGLQNTSTLLRKISSIENEWQQINIECLTLQRKLDECIRELQEQHDLKTRIKVLNTKLQKLQKTQEIMDVCNEAFSVRGIPFYIVSKVIEEVNDTIPSIISEINFWQYLDVEVKIAGDEQDTIIINAKIGDKPGREFEGLSGGEKEIVSFIVGRAYNRVLENLIDINYNFIIIDEVLDVLDESNMKAIISYFKKLKIQSLCISHNDLRDTFQETIIVKNRNGIVSA